MIWLRLAVVFVGAFGFALLSLLPALALIGAGLVLMIIGMRRAWDTPRPENHPQTEHAVVTDAPGSKRIAVLPAVSTRPVVAYRGPLVGSAEATERRGRRRPAGHRSTYWTRTSGSAMSTA